MAKRDLSKVTWDALFSALDSVGMSDATVDEDLEGQVVIYTGKTVKTDSKGREYLAEMEDPE